MSKITRKRWTEKEVQWLTENFHRFSNETIHERYLPHRTLKAIKEYGNCVLGLRKDSSSMKSTSYAMLDFADEIRMKRPENVEELFEAMVVFQEASRNMSTRMDDYAVSIDTNKPVIVAFLADAHVGAVTGKYRDLLERINLIRDTDRVYVFSVGDTIDNYLPKGPHNAGVLEHLIPPALQKDMVEMLFGRLKGKWLGVVQGCHDEWSHASDDFDWSANLADHLGCPNMGFGGYCDLTVGTVTYRIGLRHKYRYNSSFNLTHTVKRLREQLGDFDIGCISHHHQADVEHLAMNDVDRVFIRPGTFKGEDRYSRQVGYADTGEQIPCVVLDCAVRKITPFLNLDDAIRFLATYD